MTLILKLDLDMVKTYLHTKNEVPMWRGSKVIAWTDRQTDMIENSTYPHTRVVITILYWTEHISMFFLHFCCFDQNFKQKQVLLQSRHLPNDSKSTVFIPIDSRARFVLIQDKAVYRKTWDSKLNDSQTFVLQVIILELQVRCPLVK